jgi:hypothetical protein
MKNQSRAGKKIMTSFKKLKKLRKISEISIRKTRKTLEIIIKLNLWIGSLQNQIPIVHKSYRKIMVSMSLKMQRPI